MSYLAQCYRQDHRTAEEAAGTLRHWPFVRGIHQSQRALNAGFDVFFHVSLKKRFNKQCNAQCMAIQRNVFYFVTFCVTKIRKLVLRQTEQLWYLFLFAYFRKKTLLTDRGIPRQKQCRYYSVFQTKSIWGTIVFLLSGVPDLWDRTKILRCGDLSHLHVPDCIWVFFYFVWFLFIHHNIHFYFESCTYCNTQDIYLL